MDDEEQSLLDAGDLAGVGGGGGAAGENAATSGQRPSEREKMPPLPSPNQGGRWSQDVDTMQSPETRTAVQCTPVFLRETKLKTGGSLADVLLIVLEYSSSSQPCIYSRIF